MENRKTERIDSIDTLRGFSLLGILLLNIADFGLPFAAYANPTVGNAIIGGYVYRGAKIPAYQGAYFFSDAGKPFVKALRLAPPNAPRVAALTADAGGRRDRTGDVGQVDWHEARRMRAALPSLAGLREAALAVQVTDVAVRAFTHHWHGGTKACDCGCPMEVFEHIWWACDRHAELRLSVLGVTGATSSVG